MKRPVFKFALYACMLVAVGVVGIWITQSKHARAAQDSSCAAGPAAYWYDPMVPAQHFDQPGKSPFMDMQLVPKCTDETVSTLGDRGGAERKPLYWYDPMVPAQHFDQAGKSPFMDMQLVPKFPDEGTAASIAPAGSIAVDPRVVQSLGVRLAPVEQGQFARVVDAVGLIAVDEHRIQVVQIRAPGWVEELKVRAVGDPVRRGQLLAAIYSPDLLATQQELLIALASGDGDLIRGARQRLVLLGLSEGQIARVEASRQPEKRVNYYAPFDGYVMELGVRQGAAVQPDTVLFQLADLRTVWVNAEVPEAQAAWIKAGDRAEAEVSALPGERFKGTVDYVYPELMSSTRTLKMRVVLMNSAQRLRPGMFAATRLLGIPKEQAVLIPTEAVIKTGTRSVVIVSDDENHFHPAFVQVGAEYGGKSEILEGLTPGQQVVASGQFLIDSEAGLRGAFSNLTGTGDGKTQDEDTSLAPVPSGQER